MRIVAPNAQEMFDINPQRHIEAIGRICYKSEDRITEDSHKEFVLDMRERKHSAMLEHFRFIMRVPCRVYQNLLDLHNPYIVCTYEKNGFVVSGSARAFIEATEYVEQNIGKFGITNGHLVDLLTIQKHLVAHYGCEELFGQSPCRQSWIEVIEDVVFDTIRLSPYEKYKHGWHSVMFTCDRGVTHELVRHRPASFAQESTRYCNYSLGKYGSEISVIKPLFFEPGTEQYNLWEKSMMYLEQMYIQMLHAGCKPQEARSVLPNSVKADIVLTATNEEWDHILDLRYLQTTGSAHPQMVEVMTILVDKSNWAKKLTSKEDL